jgi:hypothetical protein
MDLLGSFSNSSQLNRKLELENVIVPSVGVEPTLGGF